MAKNDGKKGGKADKFLPAKLGGKKLPARADAITFKDVIEAADETVALVKKGGPELRDAINALYGLVEKYDPAAAARFADRRNFCLQVVESMETLVTIAAPVVTGFKALSGEGEKR